MRKNAQTKGLQIQPTPPYRASDARSFQTIGSPDAVRQLSRWVFESKIGERCKTTFGIRENGEGYNSRYVVAGLKNILPKGLPSVSVVKEQITPLVKNRKKGEALAAKINSTDLNALAAQFNTKIDTSRGISFNSQFIPNLGAETKVVGAAFTTEVGQVTKPIVGETGVFIAKVVNKGNTQPMGDKTQLREQLTNDARNRVMSPDQRTGRQMLIKGLAKKADIKDNRLKFF
ncbi:MAG: hypothetical protein HC817_11685 [Saprospiraceae bacterium]|nr:hypothetical protein [Saprospiraceae bacterium]